jgi:hypothetical protein
MCTDSEVLNLYNSNKNTKKLNALIVDFIIFLGCWMAGTISSFGGYEYCSESSLSKTDILCQQGAFVWSLPIHVGCAWCCITSQFLYQMAW